MDIGTAEKPTDPCLVDQEKKDIFNNEQILHCHEKKRLERWGEHTEALLGKIFSKAMSAAWGKNGGNRFNSIHLVNLEEREILGRKWFVCQK